MARTTRLGPLEVQEISERLGRYASLRFPTLAAFERATGAGHSTVAGWFEADPHPPDTSSLALLAKNHRLNVNWLLTGIGHELQGVESSRSVWELLRDALVAEIAAASGLSVEEVKTVIADRDLWVHRLCEFALEDYQRSGLAHGVDRAGISAAIEKAFGRVVEQPTPQESVVRRAEGRTRGRLDESSEE